MPKLPFFKKKENNFEAEIETGLSKLLVESETMEDYLTVMELYKAYIETSEKRSKISPDTVFNGIVSLLGVLLILNYEKLGVLTSKALKFVRFH